MLDLGAPDPRMARALADRGVERYLAFVDAEDVERVRTEAGDLAHRFQPLDDITVAQHGVGDLLILRAAHRGLMWGWSRLQQWRWLAVEDVSSMTRLAGLAARTRGRMRLSGMWNIGDSRFLVFEQTPILEDAARIYFPPQWGVGGLAQRLADHRIQYAVLRWFDQLPHIDPGEDLDILVRDEDVSRFRQLVSTEPATQPIDLYSVSGLDGSDFRGAAYYVPALARRILDGAVVHSSGMLVPNPVDHFHSLAYHALYHKGPTAGVPSSLIEVSAAPEHDYVAGLTAAAEEAGEIFAGDMESTDLLLAAHGWRPPSDALRRLAPHNPWLRAQTADEGGDDSGSQFAAFLVRERTLDVLAEEEIVGLLERWGFETLRVDVLDADDRARGAAELRGGNWARGPYPVSGGVPAMLIASVHHAPAVVSDALRERYPHLANQDILFAKQEMRELIEARVGADAAFNGLHSADDEDEAWHYIEVIIGSARDEIAAAVAERTHAHVAPEGSMRCLSRGRRARVDVVMTDEGPVVRKSYTDAARRYFVRETAALDALLGRIPAVPAILDRGENWFTMPYFDDVLAGAPRPLSPPVLREMVQTLRSIREAGWVLVDAKPDNFVWGRGQGLRIVDLEFAYRAGPGAPSLEAGPEFAPPDPGAYRDIPAGESGYTKRWLPSTAMPVAVLLQGSLVKQVMHQWAHRLRRMHGPGSTLRAPIRFVRGLARTAVSALRLRIEEHVWRQYASTTTKENKTA